MFFLQQLIDGIMYGSVYSLIGVGFTLIFGVLNLINLAHGEVIIGSAFVGFYLHFYFKLNFVMSSFLATISGAIIGVMIEYTAIRPLRKATQKVHHLAAMISTMGASIFIAEFLTRIFTSEATHFINPIGDSQIQLGGIYFRTSYLITFGISLICVVLLHTFVKKTKIGRAIRVVSENIMVSNLMGIDVNRIATITVAIASSIGAIGGILMATSCSAITPAMGGEATLKGLVVIILGGLGSLEGAVVGGLILGVVEFLCVAYISTSYRDAFAFGVLFLLLIAKPTGLFGKKID